jgi:hypothetical protein
MANSDLLNSFFAGAQNLARNLEACKFWNLYWFLQRLTAHPGGSGAGIAIPDRTALWTVSDFRRMMVSKMRLRSMARVHRFPIYAASLNSSQDQALWRGWGLPRYRATKPVVEWIAKTYSASRRIPLRLLKPKSAFIHCRAMKKGPYPIKRLSDPLPQLPGVQAGLPSLNPGEVAHTS